MDKQKAGLIGLITILTLYGGAVTLTPQEADSTYYCVLTNQIAIFDRLSDTQKTGYYMDANIEKSIQCRAGSQYAKWVTLKEYAADANLSYNDLIQNPVQPEGVTYVTVFGNNNGYSCLAVNNALGKYSKCYIGGVFRGYLGEYLC